MAFCTVVLSIPLQKVNYCLSSLGWLHIQQQHMQQIWCQWIPNPEDLQGWRGIWSLWWSQNCRYLPLMWLIYVYMCFKSSHTSTNTPISRPAYLCHLMAFVLCLSPSFLISVLFLCFPLALCRWDRQFPQEAGWTSFGGAQGWRRLAEVHYRPRRKCRWWVSVCISWKPLPTVNFCVLSSHMNKHGMLQTTVSHTVNHSSDIIAI